MSKISDVSVGASGAATDSTRRRKPVPAVSRAIKILRLLSKTNQPLSMTEVAQQLDLVPSTCLHILRLLTDEGLITFNPSTKRYKLGFGILTLTAGVLRHSSFAEAAQPVLDQVTQQYRITSFAIERASFEQHTVVAVSDSHVFNVRIVVGTSFPAFASASGRCVAAYFDGSKEALEKEFSKLRWQASLSFRDWLAQVRRAKVNGYGLDIGHFFRGITILSVPIPGERGPVSRCLAAVGLTEQFNGAMVDEVAQRLQAEAARMFPS